MNQLQSKAGAKQTKVLAVIANVEDAKANLAKVESALEEARALCDAMVRAAQAHMRLAAAREAAIPEGTIAIDHDFADPADARRPPDDYYDGKGRLVARGARWRVVKVKRERGAWRRVRWMSPPIGYEEALERKREIAEFRKLPYLQGSDLVFVTERAP